MPLIDDDIIQIYNKKYHENNVKKPNIVNGLSEIRIMQSLVSLPSLPPPTLHVSANLQHEDGAMM
jgi:hypothetical protein